MILVYDLFIILINFERMNALTLKLVNNDLNNMRQSKVLH